MKITLRELWNIMKNLQQLNRAQNQEWLHRKAKKVSYLDHPMLQSDITWHQEKVTSPSGEKGDQEDSSSPYHSCRHPKAFTTKEHHSIYWC